MRRNHTTSHPAQRNPRPGEGTATGQSGSSWRCPGAFGSTDAKTRKTLYRIAALAAPSNPARALGTILGRIQLALWGSVAAHIAANRPHGFTTLSAASLDRRLLPRSTTVLGAQALLPAQPSELWPLRSIATIPSSASQLTSASPDAAPLPPAPKRFCASHYGDPSTRRFCLLVLLWACVAALCSEALSLRQLVSKARAAYEMLSNLSWNDLLAQACERLRTSPHFDLGQVW